MSPQNLHIPNYKVQLDSLRAIAVFMVILSHWLPKPFHPLGYVGVQLFFVLSGYLITGILLEAKRKADYYGSSKRGILKGFYARRFLRIFPLYYLTILGIYFLPVADIQNYLTWHVLYLTNILIIIKNEWLSVSSHFWSLAVEEQFYLFWPFVILFIPQKYLKTALTAVILSAPAFLYSCELIGIDNKVLEVLPISSFHTLGAGALLACLEFTYKYEEVRYATYRNVLTVCAAIALIIIVTIRMLDLHLISSYSILSDFILAILLVGIVSQMAQGVKGIPGRLLSLSPIVYIGRISYGLYILHNYIPLINVKIATALGVNLANLSPHFAFVLNTTSLVALSSLSWFFFEKRINSLKQYFPYVKQTEKRPVYA